MPRVHHVKKARKDNPAVKRGEPYYWWKFRGGGKHYSAKPPRPSQLTQSEFLGAVYAAQEQLEELTPEEYESVADLQGTIESVASEIRDAGEESRARVYDLPENFQQGEQAQMMEERGDSAEEMANALESIDYSGPGEGETLGERLQAVIEEAQSVQYEGE